MLLIVETKKTVIWKKVPDQTAATIVLHQAPFQIHGKD